MTDETDAQSTTLRNLPADQLVNTLKNGKPVSLELHEDAERMATPVSVCHEVLARVNGEPAGYLKIAYIPGERFDKEIPNVRTFMGKVEGVSGVYEADQSVENTLIQLKLSIRCPRGLALPGEAEIKSMTEKQQEELLTWADRKLASTYKGRIERYKAFHVDAPRVDFIRVYDGAETYSHDNAASDGEPLSGDDYQGQGLAKILYRTAAAWMADNDLVLHASGIQEPASFAAWQSMAEDGWPVYTAPDPVHGDRERWYLDFRHWDLTDNPDLKMSP